MPEPTAPESSRTPDVETIRHLVRLMHRYDLTAIDLSEGPSRIRLRRRRDSPAAPASTPTTPPVAPAAPPAPIAPPSGSAPPSEPSGLKIESPMVGTFYSAPAPDAPEFVSIGSVVRPETIVAVIEAMKVFTEIPAGVAGTIAEVLVKSGQSVDFGRPLFRVTPA